MKHRIPVALIVLLTAAACGRSDPDEPAERLDKPYADKVKELEQQQLQQAQDQLKAIDEQSTGRRSKDGDEG